MLATNVREYLKAAAAVCAFLVSLTPAFFHRQLPPYVGSGIQAFFTLVSVGFTLFIRPPKRTSGTRERDS